MTFKIRKLYNVLVVGGMMAAGTAACTKDDKKEPAKTEPSKTEPAKAETPKTEPAAKVEEPKTEPAKTEPAKTDPAAKVDDPAKADPGGPVKIDDKKATTKKKVPAKDAKKDDKAGGVPGWS